MFAGPTYYVLRVYATKRGKQSFFYIAADAFFAANFYIAADAFFAANLPKHESYFNFPFPVNDFCLNLFPLTHFLNYHRNNQVKMLRILMNLTVKSR